MLTRSQRAQTGVSTMIRGPKNPFPKVKPATNSGIFSDSGKGQKLDPVKRTGAVAAAFNEAYKTTNLKAGSR
jgi:hypothetical protein